MQAREKNSGAGETRRRPLSARRIWALGVDGLAALGTLMIVLLMGMICADVVARNLFGASLPLISELGAFTLVMIVYLQLGATIRNERLAGADLFLVALGQRSPRAAALFSALWALVGLAICAAIAYSTYGIVWRSYEHHDFIGVTGVMTMPTWPFRVMVFLGATVAAAQFLVQCFVYLRKAVGRSEIVE